MTGTAGAVAAIGADAAGSAGAASGAGGVWRGNGDGVVSSCMPRMLMNLQAKLCTMNGVFA